MSPLSSPSLFHGFPSRFMSRGVARPRHCFSHISGVLSLSRSRLPFEIPLCGVTRLRVRSIVPHLWHLLSLRLATTKPWHNSQGTRHRCRPQHQHQHHPLSYFTPACLAASLFTGLVADFPIVDNQYDGYRRQDQWQGNSLSD